MYICISLSIFFSKDYTQARYNAQISVLETCILKTRPNLIIDLITKEGKFNGVDRIMPNQFGGRPEA